MNAIISGRAGLALLVGENAIHLIRVGDPAVRIECDPEDFWHLFADAGDLEVVEDTESGIVERLIAAVDGQEALDLTLILLDSDLSQQTCAAAGQELDELLARREAAERAERYLFAHPLPALADCKAALDSVDLQFDRVRAFLQRLEHLQPWIREVWAAFESALHVVPADELSHDDVRAVAAQRGLYREIVLAASGEIPWPRANARCREVLRDKQLPACDRFVSQWLGELNTSRPNQYDETIEPAVTGELRETAGQNRPRRQNVQFTPEERTTDDSLILVAGGGGFIGGHLVADLLRRGFTNVRSVDIKPLDEWCQVFGQVENVVADLKEKDACIAACRDAYEVYNLAADMGGMGFIENNKALCMLSVLINTHLLAAAQQAGVSRYFYASSACVYNADKQRSADVAPLKEEDAYPAMAEDGYGWEKLFSERMCRHFREDFGLVTRVARFHNVYGPHGTWEGGREKAPAAVCRKVLHAQATGVHEIEIWGDGNQTRSFMYIDDCIQGIDRIMHSDIEEPINLGSSELVSINDLVSLVEGIAGIKLNRSHNLSAPKGVNGRSSDNTKIQGYLGWEPVTRLREGLARTYNWIRDEYHAKYGNQISNYRTA